MSTATITDPATDTEPTLDLATRPARIPSTWPSADTIKSALAEATYTQPEISDVLWLLDHARQERIPHYQALTELLNYDGHSTVVSRIVRGVYAGDREPFFSKLRAYRQITTERLDFGNEPFVETQVFRDLSSLCDLARLSSTIGLIYGPNQSGKTRAAQRYAELNNHGRTIYVRMPVGGSARMMLIAIARACGISERNSYDQLRDRLLRYFDSTMLLVVDETHQAMIGRGLKTVTIDLLREISDLCGCGVVLIGTDVLPDMISDPRFRKFLGQIDNRGVLRRRIPAAPPARDTRAICAAYGLPRETGDGWQLAKRIAKESGLGKLTKYLRMARKLAANKSQPFAWSHVLATHATLVRWASGHVKEDDDEDTEE